MVVEVTRFGENIITRMFSTSSENRDFIESVKHRESSDDHRPPTLLGHGEGLVVTSVTPGLGRFSHLWHEKPQIHTLKINMYGPFQSNAQCV